MLRRIIHWLHNRPRRLRGRLAARAIAKAFPEILTVEPVRDIKNWLLTWF